MPTRCLISAMSSAPLLDMQLFGCLMAATICSYIAACQGMSPASAGVDHDFVQPAVLPRDASARTAWKERGEGFMVAPEYLPASGLQEEFEYSQTGAELCPNVPGPSARERAGHRSLSARSRLHLKSISGDPHANGARITA